MDTFDASPAECTQRYEPIKRYPKKKAPLRCSEWHLLLQKRRKKMKHTKSDKLLDSYDETETCTVCGNTYKVDLIKEGDDWNDFGYRYCPFCGDMTDLYA